jgi:1,4-dihydroxy-2-naphthoate octaprenyltransferase
VFVGVAVSLYEVGSFRTGHFALALVGALLSHVSVNVLNDYFDYRSGLDFHTRRTPFSGGSGMLPEGLLNPRSVYWFGVGCLLALVPIGLYFLSVYGLGLLPIGVLGMLVIYFYTTHITRLPLGEIAAGLGFGPLMVLGVYFTQVGAYSAGALAASLVPGFLVADLLLLNELPDVEADLTASRRHTPIAFGRRAGARIYSLLIVGTYVWLGISVVLRLLPPAALLGLATLPLGIDAMRGALRYHDDMEGLLPYQARNIQVVLLTPLAMSLGVLIASL